MTVNEELTAEEWKRRYEKEKERVGRLKGKVEKLETELSRYTQGLFTGSKTAGDIIVSNFFKNLLSSSFLCYEI